MSFLNQIKTSMEDALSEDIEVVDELDPQEEAEAEQARADAEAATEYATRAVAVTDELQGQEEALGKIVKDADEKGETVPGSTLAGFEAARRNAARALGLNPDEGVGAEIVDEAGLESIKEHGVAALEAEDEKKEGIFRRLWNWIKGVFKTIGEKISKFLIWVRKKIQFLDKDIKETYKAVKAMSDEDFKAKIETMVSSKNISLVLATSGESDIVDPQIELRTASKAMNGNKVGLVNTAKAFYNRIRDKADIENVVKDIKESFQKVEVHLSNTDFIIDINDDLKVERTDKLGDRESLKATKDSVSKQALLNALNCGSSIYKLSDEVKKANDEADKAIENATKEAEKKADGKEAAVVAAVKKIATYKTSLSTANMQLVNLANRHYQAVCRLAKSIVKKADTSDDAEK